MQVCIIGGPKGMVGLVSRCPKGPGSTYAKNGSNQHAVEPDALPKITRGIASLTKEEPLTQSGYTEDQCQDYFVTTSGRLSRPLLPYLLKGFTQEPQFDVILTLTGTGVRRTLTALHDLLHSEQTGRFCISSLRVQTVL